MDKMSITENASKQVEAAADEAVQAAMVKTALRANFAGESAVQTRSLGDVKDELAARERVLNDTAGEYRCGAD